MTVSVFDHPLLRGYLGDPEIASFFSVAAELAALLDFEAALAQAEAKHRIIPAVAATAIGTACTELQRKPNLKALAAGVARDGVVVPTLVSQLRRKVGKSHAEYVHFGATSQDAVDTGLVMRLRRAAKTITKRAEELARTFRAIEHRHGDTVIAGRTRMRRALDIRLKHRVQAWRWPIDELARDATQVQQNSLVLQFGGPVGTLAALNQQGPRVTHTLGDLLRLPVPNHSWHNDRTQLIAFADWLAKLSGCAGKMGLDLCLMGQDEIAEVQLQSGGTSSAMPHKSNPVLAEALVALARFNATLVAGMHQAQLHEQERSGAAWTLEWMLLPQLTVATAASVRLAHEAISNVEFV